MGRIEADIALESWLFGFRPCSGQGQFTLVRQIYTDTYRASVNITSMSNEYFRFYAP